MIHGHHCGTADNDTRGLHQGYQNSHITYPPVEIKSKINKFKAINYVHNVCTNTTQTTPFQHAMLIQRVKYCNVIPYQLN